MEDFVQHVGHLFRPLVERLQGIRDTMGDLLRQLCQVVHAGAVRDLSQVILLPAFHLEACNRIHQADQSTFPITSAGEPAFYPAFDPHGQFTLAVSGDKDQIRALRLLACFAGGARILKEAKWPPVNFESELGPESLYEVIAEGSRHFPRNHIFVNDDY